MIVKRLFFPSHGRLDRRVNHRRAEHGQKLVACVWSFWWGPFCAFLVYEEETDRAVPAGLPALEEETSG